MPELSKPLIAILGVVISVAILFIAIAGFLPFFQQSVSTTTQQAQFSGTAVGAKLNGTNVLFTVTISKLVGTGTYKINSTSITVYDPDGNTPTTTVYTNLPITFTAATSSATFTINAKSSTLTGTWTIVIDIYSDNNVVQTLTLQPVVS